MAAKKPKAKPVSTKPSTLGRFAIDRVTGFKGRITAICVYLAGDTRIQLETLDKKTGRAIGEWFDLARVKVSA